MINHFMPTSLFLGLSCAPTQEFDKSIRKERAIPGRPKPLYHKVKKLLWKRSLGLTLKASAHGAKLSEATCRVLFHRLGIPIDVIRSASEIKLSAVTEYLSGKSCIEISEKYHVGASTVHRWVRESGHKTRSISEAKALYCASRPAGSLLTGKKGLFHTTKGSVWIPTDSVYEYARLDQLEANPDVTRIGRCSDRIRYRFEEKSRTYIPDFKVHYADGSVFVEEIKPSRWRNDPKVLAKEEAAIAYYQKIGIVYRMICEPEIGLDRILACDVEVLGRQLPEYRKSQTDKRREQRRVAQLAYTKRKKQANAEKSSP